MRASEIQPGDMILNQAEVEEVSPVLTDNGRPAIVRVDGEDYSLTVPADWEIPVNREVESHEVL